MFDGQTVVSCAAVGRRLPQATIHSIRFDSIHSIEMLLAELMGGVAIGNSNVDVYYFLRSEIKYSYEKVARSEIKYTFV
jgi:hypothetical protein